MFDEQLKQLRVVSATHVCTPGSRRHHKMEERHFQTSIWLYKLHLKVNSVVIQHLTYMIETLTY